VASPPVDRAPATVRTVAWNFLAGGSRNRSGHWSRAVRTLGGDIVFAQECRPPGESSGRRLRLEGDDALLWERAGTRAWGSALLARSARIEPIHMDGFDGWIVGGQLTGSAWAGGRAVRAFSIHAPAGAHGYIRTMHDIVDRLVPLARDADLILGGDFNVVVGYRVPTEKRRTSRGERVLLDRIADELGLVSCWQAANPDCPLAQTLRWTANRREPYHCDGIFVPRTWLPRLVSCRIPRGSRWYQLSDHNPVVAEFHVRTDGVT
jgi:endonuclease/exonuclease/phosphatase family metal-dependent hydrolase